jgi:hypothetical protein
MNDPKSQTVSQGGELADELKTIVSESLQSSSKAFLRSMNLFRTVATRMPQQNIGALDLATNWARINVETSRIISRHSQEAVSEILDALEHYGLVETGPIEAPCAEVEEKPQGRVIIDLSSKRGQKATALFAISNPGPNTMEATFGVTEFTNEDGHQVENVKARFSPAKLKLLPDQETAVAISVDVSNKFRVDKCYRSNIQLPEYPGKEIALQLQVNRAGSTKKGRTKGKKA